VAKDSLGLGGTGLSLSSSLRLPKLQSPTTPRRLLRTPNLSRSCTPRATSDGFAIFGDTNMAGYQAEGPRARSKASADEKLKPMILPGACERQRYRATESAPWDAIAENAAQLDFGKRATCMQGTLKASTVEATAVILAYSNACNPFHLGDIDVLQRAKKAIEAFQDVVVIGALVVPSSEEHLREKGVDDRRRLPFTVRRDAARYVISAAEQAKWIVVDCCREGSLKHVTGSLVPYLMEYVKCRLHRTNWDARVLEVRAQDPLDAPLSVHKGTTLRVPMDLGGRRRPGAEEAPTRPAASFKAVMRVLVDVPKQEHFDDLLHSSVQQAHDPSVQTILERLCGLAAASLIREWAGRTRGQVGRKSALVVAA